MKSLFQARFASIALQIKEQVLSVPSDQFFLVVRSHTEDQSWLRAFHSACPELPLPRPVTMWEWCSLLAEPVLSHKQLKLLSPAEQEARVSRILHTIQDQLSDKDQLQIGIRPGLALSLTQTIHEMRLAEIDACSFDPDVFPLKAKGRFLQAVLAAYEQDLKYTQSADPATVISLARDRLLSEKSIPAFHLILPEEITCTGLLQSVLDQVPDSQHTVLKKCTQESLPLIFDTFTNSQRLAWLEEPAKAPPAQNDSTVKLYRALSPEFEVRGVIGTILQGRIPFDQVEVLYSDELLYPELFYSLLAGVQNELVESIPMTLAAGVPVSWTRPGRAIRFWLSWIASDFHYDDLAELLIQNLLNLPAGVTPDSLLAVLQSHPGCVGKDAWKQLLQIRLQDQSLPDQVQQSWRLLQQLLDGLFSLSMDSASSGSAWNGVEQFLSKQVRTVDERDVNAQRMGLEFISAYLENPVEPAADVYDRLRTWMQETHLPAESERPGAMMLTPISSQISMRRPFTFCVGMSEDAFPSIPRRRSLLLDRERKGISPELEQRTVRELIHQQEKSFISLLGQLEGNVVLTYSCADQIDDRELFPSQLFLRIFRLTAQLPEGDLHELESWLPPPLGPESSLCRIYTTEEWLDHWPAQPFRDPLFKKDFSLLSRGAFAAKQRRGLLFTEHDGYVTAAGALFDVQRSNYVFSAHALQLFARCPLQFFYQHVLQIRPLDVMDVPPGQWLHPLQRGHVLHAVFHQYHLQLLQEKRKPEALQDAPLLRSLLDAELRQYEAELPSVPASIRDAEIRDLHETLHLFLTEETTWTKDYTPRYFETSIGIQNAELTNVLDSRKPVAILLPSGRSILVQGRVDRIDEHRPAEGDRTAPDYFVWDYKTGSMRDYQNDSARRSGQLLQPLLYQQMVEKRLREVVDKQARVTGAGFFFPSQRGGQGDRISWTAEDLQQDAKVIDTLIDLLQSGVFLGTDQPDVCRTCSFQDACHVNEVVKQSAAKLKFTQNTVLKPLWPLRRSS